MLIVPKDFRAPLFIPGRRNRRVHWNRPLSRAMAMLGRFEREDYYRGSIRPWSLRQFFPAWNNQFSPGGGSGCGCCSESDPCGDCEDCMGGTSPTECEVDVPAFSTLEPGCVNCSTIEGTYILTPFSGLCSWSWSDTDSGVCGSLTVLTISLTFTCVDSKCRVSGRVLINYPAEGIQGSYYNDGSVPPPASPNLYTYASLPWSLPYVGEGLPTPGHVNCTPDGNPMIVQGFA